LRVGVRIAVVCLLAVAIAAAAWPRELWFEPSWAGKGVDFSWGVALHLAALHDIAWGPEALFPYGPLGFLAVPLLISPTSSALGLGFVALVVGSLAIAFLLSCMRFLPLPLAVVAAWALVVLVDTSALAPIPEAAALGSLLFVSLALGDGLGPQAARLSPFALAALAAVLLLVKTSSGLVLATALPFAVVAEPRAVIRRGVAASALFLAVLAAAWLAAGQSLAALPDWLRGELALIAGYSEGMALEEAERSWEYVGFAGFAVAFGLAFVTAADRRRPRRLMALAGILATSGFLFWKAGFVRHGGPGHPALAFSFLVIAPLMVPWRARFRLLGPAFTAVAAVMQLLVLGIPSGSLFDPTVRVRELASQLSTIASLRARTEMQATSRAAIREMVSLPPAILAALEGHRVHVDPQDVAIVWAYDLTWAPVPVFQAYSAYTPELDRRNARRLDDPRGPDRILRLMEGTIDDRYPVWETPEYALARLCRYRELVAEGRFQVLERGPDRCGPEREVGSALVHEDELVSVPAPSAPDRIVVARLLESPSFSEQVRSTLFKPASPLVALVRGRRGRLVRANVGGPLLVRIPATSGWSPPFNGQLSIDQFAIEGTKRPMEVRFAEIALAPPPALTEH